MSGAENIMFADRNVKPTDELIFSVIGDKKEIWKEIMHHVRSAYTDAQGEWNYYNDGKRWLFKMVLKKKTIFWVAVLEGTFRVTFYFGDKAESLIESGNLPQNMKVDFRTGKRYGKIRAISIKVSGQEDVDHIKELMYIKVKIK